MIGVYRTLEGDLIEREFADGRVPDHIERGAKLCKMRTGTLRKDIPAPFTTPRVTYGVTSMAFMEWEGKGVPGMEAPAYSKSGNPCFETKGQAREFALKHGMYYGDRGGSYGYGRGR